MFDFFIYALVSIFLYILLIKTIPIHWFKENVWDSYDTQKETKSSIIFITSITWIISIPFMLSVLFLVILMWAVAKSAKLLGNIFIKEKKDVL